MCDEIRLNRKWLGTVGELREALDPHPLIADKVYAAVSNIPTMCLCSVDIERTLKSAGCKDIVHEPWGEWRATLNLNGET